jgi:hypothetical protein
MPPSRQPRRRLMSLSQEESVFFSEEKKQETFVTAQLWRSPPRKASGKASGSFFEKKHQKNLANSG